MTDAATPRLARGRKVYNFRCYFCHGYNGDARTLAARYIDPPPRDFTQSPGLTSTQIAHVVREGIPETAMKSFRGVLSESEIVDVAAFVHDQFVERQAVNTFYHTAANGWPRHRERYGDAYPFVLGETSATSSSEELSATERRGLRLFRSACVSCHDNEPLLPARRQVWTGLPQPPPPPPETPGEAAESYTHEELMAHGRAPEIAGLSAQEMRGEKLYQAACAECHAADGTGENWVGEFLRRHPTDFTDPSQNRRLSDVAIAQAVLDGLPHTSMPSFRGVLDRDDVAAIIAYMQRAFFADGVNDRPGTR